MIPPPTPGELRALGRATGFQPTQLDKVVRLLDVVDDVAAHPYLGERIALVGGTALAMFVLDVPRLSFDLDLNYVATADPDAMRADRPRFETEVKLLFAAHGLRLKHKPRPDKVRDDGEVPDHAGGKWVLRYRTAWGHSDGISVDVNYVRRVLLWPTVRRDSCRLGRWQATGVPVADVHEIAAGKLRAFYDRGLPRDLFDVGLIPRIPGLDPDRLRTAFVVYGASGTRDRRPWGQPPPHIEASDLANQLRPSLRATDSKRTRPRSVDDYLDELQAKALPAQRMVLPLADHEQTFVDLVLDHGRVEPVLLTEDPALQARIGAEPWLRWKTRNVRKHKAAEQHPAPPRPREDAAAGPANQPYLEVRAADDAWGWEIVLRHPSRPGALAGGPSYMTPEDALEASEFARALLDSPSPPRILEWEHGWERSGPLPGDRQSVLLQVPQVGGWVLQLGRPEGAPLLTSPLYPTHRDALSAQRFLAGTIDMSDHTGASAPTPVRAVPGCACLQRGRVCRHYHHQPPAANPISLSLSPHREAPQGWQLAIRDADQSPIEFSTPYPDEDTAVGARDFALPIVNGKHPIRFDGWKPSGRPGGPGYRQPTHDEAATTVRVRPPPDNAPHMWRLQATRPEGYVIRTSLPYPTSQAATEALAFLGTLTALTGDPARTGRVRDTTQPADLVCDCKLLGTACLHYPIKNPDTRRRDRNHTGRHPGI